MLAHSSGARAVEHEKEIRGLEVRKGQRSKMPIFSQMKSHFVLTTLNNDH